jgi:anti-sigma regulatory factor (Ser/Thr protein kinase)
MHSSNLTGRTAKIGPDHPNAPRFTPTHADCIPRDPAARDPQWPDHWPLRTHLELAPLDTAPGSARAHVTAVLREWKASGDAVDDGAAVVTELIMNAVETTWKHGLYVPVRLWMLGDQASALLLVWDVTDPAPVLRDSTPDAEHGRGLHMVNGLSQRWGYYHPGEQPFGKVVWAAIRTAPVVPGSTATGFVS